MSVDPRTRKAEVLDSLGGIRGDVTRRMRAIIALPPGEARSNALGDLIWGGTKVQTYYASALVLVMMEALPSAILQSVMPDDPPTPGAGALAAPKTEAA